MKTAINGLDYTQALDAVRPLTIDRKLNQPSSCQFWLSVQASGSLPAPERSLSVRVTGDDGTVYFTGFIAATPLPEYAGMGIEGPLYRAAIEALSDDAMLDLSLLPAGTVAAGETPGALVSTLMIQSGSTALKMDGAMSDSTIGRFEPGPGARWSVCAGEVAGQARAAYRALNGALTVAPIGSVAHALSETDGSLSLANLTFSSAIKRGMANDITVCGAHEAAAYVSEYFIGDGLTSQFNLESAPYFESSSRSVLIQELFNEAQVDARVWSVAGDGAFLTVGDSGLAMNGGNGVDGDTAICWLHPVELGGTLLLEVSGVTLAPGSTGVLAGMYGAGKANLSACIAGFQVSSETGTGSLKIQPVIQGAASGPTYPINPANQYTLRVRVHCNEMERVTSVFRSFGDSGEASYGGQWILSAGKLLLEVQEFVDGVAGMPVGLYDGSIASLPSTGTVIPASSTNLIGTMRAVNLTDLGSGWVVSTPVGGAPYTRRCGTAAEAAECRVERAGMLLFNPGYVPQAGERVAVSYRGVGRAAGRAVNAVSQRELAEAGRPSVAAWIGTVTSPAARSSTDCRNAAQALGAAAASASALWSGRYKSAGNEFKSDVWPGDVLIMSAPSTSLDTDLVVREVRSTYRASYPECAERSIEFSNDWAEDLAIRTSELVPADARLPAAITPVYLANLAGLTVTALNESTVTVNTGLEAPAGGGFEIRRRDFVFMPGQDPDLVGRAPTSTITFARESANDRFYIRMFDGSTPRRYSEFSTALLIHLPFGS